MNIQETREEREAKRKAEDLQMMKRPDDWPNWPLLPMRRSVRDRLGGMPNCGLFLAEKNREGKWCFAPNLNLWDPKVTAVLNGPRDPAIFRWVTPEELIEEGWEID
jgi:hypothetical protein